jgi:hypothetical protein
VLSVKQWKFRWIALLIVVFFLVLEGTSSGFLFRYYSHKQSPLSPQGTATAFLIKKALGLRPADAFEVDKPEMFRPDTVLGYTTNPGIYRIIETSGGKRHGYHVTVTESGVRATSYRPTTASRRIYILGNSSIWAVGLDDEMTPPWLLQARLPNYQVINLALTGYSNVQQLLQYRRIKDNLHPDDIVIFSYTAGDLLHNVADPSLIKVLSSGYEMSLSSKENFREVRIPYANLSNEGGLNISYAPIKCASREGNSCIRDIPEAKVREAIAKKIFAEIMLDRKCHVLVALFGGDKDPGDNDPVVAFLQSSGMPIADLRIKPGVDYDDYLPGEEGGHRGAFSSFRFYEVLFEALSKNQMLMSRDLQANYR